MKDLVTRLVAGVLRGLILVYRYTLSGLMGRQCRFQPTCSEYALEAITKHGPWKGGWLTLRRIGACHPWKALGSRSGYDPVP